MGTECLPGHGRPQGHYDPAAPAQIGTTNGINLIDHDELRQRLDRDVVVIAYCRGYYCLYADDVVRHLRARGRHAARFEHGLLEWSLAGCTVEA